MEGVSEVVLVRFNPAQNSTLENNLKEFYHLEVSPKCSKDLFVTKESYQKFLNGKMKERTPYEPIKSLENNFSSFGFDETNYPFLVSYTKIQFKFPSGRTMSLTEYLDKPNGITKSVELVDTGGTNLSLTSYIQAEGEVVDRFLAEILQKEKV